MPVQVNFIIDIEYKLTEIEDIILSPFHFMPTAHTLLLATAGINEAKHTNKRQPRRFPLTWLFIDKIRKTRAMVSKKRTNPMLQQNADKRNRCRVKCLTLKVCVCVENFNLVTISSD